MEDRIRQPPAGAGGTRLGSANGPLAATSAITAAVVSFAEAALARIAASASVIIMAASLTAFAPLSSARASSPAPFLATNVRPTCDAASLERDLRFLASDELEGRGLGSEGLQQALRAAARRFSDLGLQPAFPEKASPDDPLAGYFQEFEAAGHPRSANVIGILPGSPALSPRAVILGAHADHLGRDPHLKGDQIYNGADDNASGVASLLSIARMLAEQDRAVGGRRGGEYANPPGETVEQQDSPADSGDRTADLRDRTADSRDRTADPLDRTVVFIVFSGEESGLLGSRHYVEHPIVPNEEVIAMINLDCIGRMKDDQVIVFGTGTAREFPSILSGLNSAFDLDLIQRSEGAGAADHASFFAKQIPVLHFFTGPHEDYSKVSDEAQKINYPGLETLTNFVGELIRYIRYRGRPLTFVPAGAEQMAQMEKMSRQGERKVSLGFMPDFSMESGGMKVGKVSPGGSAARAGIEQGDVIVAIDGEPVDSMFDYASILRGHSPGDRITLTVLRGRKTIQLQAAVQERK